MSSKCQNKWSFFLLSFLTFGDDFDSFLELESTPLLRKKQKT
jgi:hypothetical protein